MEIKRAAALYFSPTGGTRRIASRLASALCPGAEELDVTVRPAASRNFTFEFPLGA